MNDLEFKTDFKHTIIHPYEQEYPALPNKNIKKIEVTLEMCTLYKGQPTGPAIIVFSHEKLDWLSFKGVGMFKNGELHMGPFICLNKYKIGLSFSKMTNGRPSDNDYLTYFQKLIKQKPTDIEETGQQYWSG